jgi:ESX secretion-associated protein EspG
VILSRQVSLPYPSFLTAWLALDLGELPTALLPGRIAPRTGESLESITERAWADLFERELATGRQLTEDLERTLRRLATANTRFYAFFHEGAGDTRSVLVAGSAVVATVDGGTVTLRPCRTASGARALVDALPDVPAAPGEPLSAPAEELARRSRPGALSTLRPAGSAALMRVVLGQPRTGGGQLFAASRDHTGHFRSHARPLSYFDTPIGRYLAAEDEGADGTRWRTLVPGDPELIAKRLNAILPR